MHKSLENILFLENDVTKKIVIFLVLVVIRLPQYNYVYHFSAISFYYYFYYTASFSYTLYFVSGLMFETDMKILLEIT